MKKMLLSVTLAVLVTERVQQTSIVGNRPTAVALKETITHHFLVSGTGQKKAIDAAKACGGAENVARTKTQ